MAFSDRHLRAVNHIDQSNVFPLDLLELVLRLAITFVVGIFAFEIFEKFQIFAAQVFNFVGELLDRRLHPVFLIVPLQPFLAASAQCAAFRLRLLCIILLGKLLSERDKCLFLLKEPLLFEGQLMFEL